MLSSLRVLRQGAYKIKINFKLLSSTYNMEQVHDNKAFTGVRLPNNVIPIHYELNLRPNLDNFTFSGDVKIDFQATETSRIVLHANDLEITAGHVSTKNEVQNITKVIYGKDSETATLEFPKAVSNNGSLFLRFTGTLNDKLKGFYRSAFKIDGTTIHAATTQFEAVDARRCFPCWDEPAMKATFKCSLTFRPTLKVNDKTLEVVALSNTPEVSREPVEGEEVKVTFSPTPKMSTYLLAFIVGPFEYIETSDGKRPVRVYTTPGKKEHGRFALEAACKSLRYYEDYFGIEYPLPKMDLIAIPDFCSGAMENWGLVTYRETCLLVDPANTSTALKQWVAIVVAHELAHQWFGNLVTMEWWTHLWLNEGFATFMEYLCADAIFPEFELWSQFVTSTFQTAQKLDSLHNSHPIEVPVSHPAEIDEIFDEISYHKGSSIIRMLYEHIGDQAFREGMKNYLTKFAYKNAYTEDLWDSLEESSKQPVRKMMSSWTSQKGFPWLSVDCSRDGEVVNLTVAQSKFSANGKLPDDESKMTWVVPISVTQSSPSKTTKFHDLLVDKQAVFKLQTPEDSWIKLNPGSISFYITAYSEKMLSKLLPAISGQSLSPIDRLGIQSDIFALCEAGKARTVDLLKLLEAFNNETDHNVWSSVDSCVGRLFILLSGTDYQDKFRALGRKLYSNIFKKLTWQPKQGEKDADAMNRSLVINRLVSFGCQEVIEEALKKYSKHLSKTEIIPADLRGAVYRAAARYGDEAAFESLFKLYRDSDLHEEKNRAARSMAFSKDESRLKRFTDFVLSDEVRIQDKPSVVASLSGSSPDVLWKLFKDNKVMFKETYQCTHNMATLVKFATQNFNSEEKAREIEQFFADNKFPASERTLLQSLERIRSNASWLARDGESIKAYLSQGGF